MVNVVLRSILAIGAHPDDVELGLGATLHRFATSDVQVRVVVLSSASLSLPFGSKEEDILRECRNSLANLGVSSENVENHDFPVRRFDSHRQEILELLHSLDRDFEPDLVFCPSLSDTHQDHEVVARECERAFRRRSILGYELPWNNRGFVPSVSISVTQNDLECKERALRCYSSQQGKRYFEPGLLSGLARLRASVVGVEYAESFDVIRMVIR